MRETFSACINAGSASSASVDVVMRIVLRWVRCDSEVKGEFLKKRAVVCCVLCAFAVDGQCVVVLCVVVVTLDANNKKVNKLRSFAPSFSTVEFCSCCARSTMTSV